MKLNKIDKISQAQLAQYNTQSNVARNRGSQGGYEYIIFATDQDLD